MVSTTQTTHVSSPLNSSQSPLPGKDFGTMSSIAQDKLYLRFKMPKCMKKKKCTPQRIILRVPGRSHILLPAEKPPKESASKGKSTTTNAGEGNSDSKPKSKKRRLSHGKSESPSRELILLQSKKQIKISPVVPAVVDNTNDPHDADIEDNESETSSEPKRKKRRSISFLLSTT